MSSGGQPQARPFKGGGVCLPPSQPSRASAAVSRRPQTLSLVARATHCPLRGAVRHAREVWMAGWMTGSYGSYVVLRGAQGCLGYCCFVREAVQQYPQTHSHARRVLSGHKLPSLCTSWELAARGVAGTDSAVLGLVLTPRGALGSRALTRWHAGRTGRQAGEPRGRVFSLSLCLSLLSPSQPPARCPRGEDPPNPPVSRWRGCRGAVPRHRWDAGGCAVGMPGRAIPRFITAL